MMFPICTLKKSKPDSVWLHCRQPLGIDRHTPSRDRVESAVAYQDAVESPPAPVSFG